MGLFSDAPRYGGVFYRSFSQCMDSPDINLFFGEGSVAQAGICGGATIVWIRYYLSHEGMYSNKILSRETSTIEMLQSALAYRDQGLSQLFIDKGIMMVRPFHYNGKSVSSADAMEVSHLVSVSHGISIFSYYHRALGPHVVAAYVDRTKRLFFFDANQGDVSIPYPGSFQWLHSYINLFLQQTAWFKVTHFEPCWNEGRFQQCLAELTADAEKGFPQMRLRARRLREGVVERETTL
ncbi:hypothetical protein [Endozoicomonas lisbonensis]|uniref:Peptidase C58 YopT-type domain-containing protein n=1 Tax=Endozoicomonas lisbonensis TaxID=3120522 RepID=A0ABV2SNQ9_9GAMM